MATINLQFMRDNRTLNSYNAIRTKRLRRAASMKETHKEPLYRQLYKLPLGERGLANTLQGLIKATVRSYD
jgi:hypothetical protein